MNYKNLIITILIIFLTGCEQIKVKDKINLNSQFKYKNSGFALIYTDDLLVEEKIDNKALSIFHKNLEKNSFVKITNPDNEKSIIAEVVSNKNEFSNFYNSVITLRIAEELSLDINEPYINLVLISKNSTFIAKKAKTFEEEKKVFEKAPVDGIKIDNLNKSSLTQKKTVKKKGFRYSIKIADFYYNQSALGMAERIKNETNIKNPVIKKISNTKYRVLLGPFNDIKTLEEYFNKIKSLNFENLEILKNV